MDFTLGLQQLSYSCWSEKTCCFWQDIVSFTFNNAEAVFHCPVTGGSALTFDLQLQGVSEVPLGVGHVTFVHSWDIPCDGGQRQGTIENLRREGGEGKRINGEKQHDARSRDHEGEDSIALLKWIWKKCKFQSIWMKHCKCHLSNSL